MAVASASVCNVCAQNKAMLLAHDSVRSLHAADSLPKSWMKSVKLEDRASAPSSPSPPVRQKLRNAAGRFSDDDDDDRPKKRPVLRDGKWVFEESKPAPAAAPKQAPAAPKPAPAAPKPAPAAPKPAAASTRAATTISLPAPLTAKHITARVVLPIACGVLTALAGLVLEAVLAEGHVDMRNRTGAIGEGEQLTGERMGLLHGRVVLAIQVMPFLEALLGLENSLLTLLFYFLVEGHGYVPKTVVEFLIGGGFLLFLLCFVEWLGLGAIGFGLVVGLAYSKIFTVLEACAVIETEGPDDVFAWHGGLFGGLVFGFTLACVNVVVTLRKAVVRADKFLGEPVGFAEPSSYHWLAFWILRFEALYLPAAALCSFLRASAFCSCFLRAAQVPDDSSDGALRHHLAQKAAPQEHRLQCAGATCALAIGHALWGRYLY